MKKKNQKHKKTTWILNNNFKPVKIHYNLPQQQQAIKISTKINGINKKENNQIRVPSTINHINLQKQNPYQAQYLENSQINNNNLIKIQINNLKNDLPYNKIYKEQKSTYNKLGSQINNLKTNYNILPETQRKYKYKEGTIGLINIGNTCYLNSALQNLKNVWPLTFYLLSNINYDKNRFTYKYCELISNLINQDKSQFYDPKEFFFKLSEYAPIFRFGEQNDSNFCILYILNLLEKETKNYTSQKILRDMKICYLNTVEEKKKFNSFINKIYEKRNSIIIDLFYGFQKDIYKCNNTNCNYYLCNFQGISVLNLSIMDNNNKPILSLPEAINYYQKPQMHINDNDFLCPICQNKNVTTQNIIISYPKNLIINLKRIGEQNFYNHNLQIPNFLEIKTSNSTYEYELIGFIKHIGGANSGHNIAICKNFFDKIWYVYDDSRVRNINNSIYGNNDYTIGTQIDKTNSFLFIYTQKENKITEDKIKFIIQKSAELRK